MTEPIHERRGLSNVMKFSGWCQPEDGLRILQQFTTGPQKLLRPAGGVAFDSEETQMLQNRITPECLGIHGSCKSATGKQQIRHQHAGHRVPPARMIDEANDRLVGLSGQLVPARRLERR